MVFKLFAILQKYDFSSKSQLVHWGQKTTHCCLRYCKSTIFQANHNPNACIWRGRRVVCDTAKVRFFKQITTCKAVFCKGQTLFAILQKYDFSSKSQHQCSPLSSIFSCLRYCKSTIFQANHNRSYLGWNHDAVVCDTAKVRFFKQITTDNGRERGRLSLFAILQKYDFSSKSQPFVISTSTNESCLRYCKSTIFQANHNGKSALALEDELFAILQKYDFSSKSQLSAGLFLLLVVVCDTAKVRFFKQITTLGTLNQLLSKLFAILQKYDFSSKSQPRSLYYYRLLGCLRYCKSTIFQANHNSLCLELIYKCVVCDTAKVRFFKQITTRTLWEMCCFWLFAILQKYDFSSKSQPASFLAWIGSSCLRYCKSTIFQANHNL